MEYDEFKDQNLDHAFNIGNKVIDKLFEQELELTEKEVASYLKDHKDIVVRFMIEAFVRAYIIAKENREEFVK